MREARAAREVILALGAFGTPELLIRSGIGDPVALRQLGVPVVSALPGVGQNLQDHPFVPGMHFRARDRLGLPRANGGGAIISWRSSAAARPDLHAFVAQGAQASPDEALSAGLSTGDVFAISPALMGSRGIGSLTVRSVAASGPRAVEIRSGFLTEQADVDALVESVDFIMDLAATRAYADVIDKPLTPPGRLSRAEKVAFVRDHCSTLFHPCGTAAMGTGPDAVVDPALSVHGVAGLRVVDASVIPVIPTCNTQAPVIAIAERAANLILLRGVVPPGGRRVVYAADFVVTMDAARTVIADGAVLVAGSRMTPIFGAGRYANLHHNLVPTCPPAWPTAAGSARRP